MFCLSYKTQTRTAVPVPTDLSRNVLLGTAASPQWWRVKSHNPVNVLRIPVEYNHAKLGCSECIGWGSGRPRCISSLAVKHAGWSWAIPSLIYPKGLLWGLKRRMGDQCMPSWVPWSNCGIKKTPKLIYSVHGKVVTTWARFIVPFLVKLLFPEDCFMDQLNV